MNAWERGLADEAYARGDHVPRSWEIVFDDGVDGCMPTGWYAIGLDKNGLPITWPQRHEYGDFPTRAEAEKFVEATIIRIKESTLCNSQS